MPEVPELKLLLVLTVVFIVGMFVFVVIFKALTIFQGLQMDLVPEADEVGASKTIQLLQLMPWLLGGLYLTLVGAIAYFMFKKYRGGGGSSGISEKELAEFRKKLR